MDAVFMLKHGIRVNGSFFTDISLNLRSSTGRIYNIHATAQRETGFMLDSKYWFPTWTKWLSDDNTIKVQMRQLTLVVYSTEWNVNVTRVPVYNFILGPRWKFNINIQLLVPESSITCFPHGILGQSYDGDDMAVFGKTDNYNSADIRTIAMAEGAIEGTAKDYIMENEYNHNFKYYRFDKSTSDICKPRSLNGMTLVKKIKR